MNFDRIRPELRTVRMVAWRELLLFRRNPQRLIVTLVQPLAFLFILGTGLHAAALAVGGIDYRTYIYPGVVGMAVLMPSFFAAGSVVYDREFGFLREMLAAPVDRWAIVLGKCIGGATVAALHGAVVVAAAGLVDVPYTPSIVFGLLGLAWLLGFVLVAIGLVLAARARQFQSYMSLVNLVALPMLLASGALFPLSGLPTWLAVITRLDPLSYVVDPMRRLVFPALDFSDPIAQETWLVPSEVRVTWGGDWVVPLWVELGLVAALGLAAMLFAIRRFERDA
ncbi:MAG: type transporter [Thermoleophilia bacterium]|nr:type transporter [Thermoleophilia bacterium]